MLQELLDYVRTFPGVWLTHGRELARWAASPDAGAGSDGRLGLGPARREASAAPRPSRPPDRARRR
jgi:hypothetical protein